MVIFFLLGSGFSNLVGDMTVYLSGILCDVTASSTQKLTCITRPVDTTSTPRKTGSPVSKMHKNKHTHMFFISYLMAYVYRVSSRKFSEIRTQQRLNWYNSQSDLVFQVLSYKRIHLL